MKKLILQLAELEHRYGDFDDPGKGEQADWLSFDEFVRVRLSLPLVHNALAKALRFTKQHKGVVTQRTVPKGIADQIGAIGEAVFGGYVGVLPDEKLYGRGKKDPGYDFRVYDRTFDVKTTTRWNGRLHLFRERAEADFYVLVKLCLPRWAVICGAISLWDFDRTSSPHETKPGVRYVPLEKLTHIDDILGNAKIAKKELRALRTKNR